MPDTYEEFISKWNELFPLTYDTKTLSFNCKGFFKTSLGEVYTKCTTDDKFKSNIRVRFDTKNECTNYEGTELLSHYHEAAYDAHMTSVAFMHILKYQEIELIKTMHNSRKGKGNKGKSSEENKEQQAVEKPKDAKNLPIDVKGHYPRNWVNRMMMDAYGSGRYYHFSPEGYQKDLERRLENPDFATTVHLTFAEGFIANLPAGTISSMFEQFGDFYLFKDTPNSVFLEFFYIDKKTVPDQKLTTLCSTIKATPELKVVEAVEHCDAPKFRAHSNFDGD